MLSIYFASYENRYKRPLENNAPLRRKKYFDKLCKMALICLTTKTCLNIMKRVV